MRRILVLVMIPSVLTFIACQRPPSKDPHVGHQMESTETKQGKEILYWTCSMHPNVQADKPGKCPICGMDLIPVYKGDQDKIVVSKEVRDKIGLLSQPVKKKRILKTVRVPGRTSHDQELYIAQQEYFSALKTAQTVSDDIPELRRRAEELLKSAQTRLHLLGFYDDAIAEIIKQGKPDESLIIPSAESGVWMQADIYEHDLVWVKIGQEAKATVPTYPGVEFYGTVKAIEPTLNSQTRSTHARIFFPKTGTQLKHEMYTIIEIKINLGEHTVIPKTAVIDTGLRKLVYLDLGEGRYQGKEVQVGPEDQQDIAVLSGLKLTDKIVVSGNFILDSQTTLSGGQSLLYGGAKEIKAEKK